MSPDFHPISWGYNSFPAGINDNVSDRFERPEKYFWFEHAERNAIYNAARVGTPTENAILYVSGYPCMDCARGIVQAGIKEVKISEEWCRGNPEFVLRWKDQIDRTIQLFKEARVELTIV